MWRSNTEGEKKEHTVWAKRGKDLTAAWMVGNGMLLLLAPRKRALLWLLERPEWLRKLTLWYAEHPTVMRLRGVAGVGIGLWLALRQYEEVPPKPWYQRLVSR